MAETLSFAATARHFFLGTSVVSKHISAMEDDLQTKLFVRDSRNVRLTEDGEAFYRDIVGVVGAFDRAISISASRKVDASGFHLVITIGSLKAKLPSCRWMASIPLTPSARNGLKAQTNA